MKTNKKKRKSRKKPEQKRAVEGINSSRSLQGSFFKARGIEVREFLHKTVANSARMIYADLRNRKALKTL
jgi:hypothetical protein